MRRRTFRSRRRFGRRTRRFRKSTISRGSRSRAVSYSTQSTRGTKPVYFKSRKFNPRRFRSQLLLDTRSNAHYRSIGQVEGGISSAATPDDMTITNISVLTNGVAAFWFATGGCAPIDTAISVPFFQGDIVVRGGKWTFSFINNSVDVLKVFIWYYWSIERPDFTLLPPVVPASWDPTVMPDFRNSVGKILKSEVHILKPADGINWERRLSAMKVDQVAYNNSGNLPHILIGVQNLSSFNARSGSGQTGFNLSFSADAIGTT